MTPKPDDDLATNDALDDFPPLRLHPQEIRSTALQAASRITARTQYKTDDAGELALDLAARFETYIEYGSLTDVDNTEKGTDPWANPDLWVGSMTITPEKIAAGREKLLAAIRGDYLQGCTCEACTRARNLIDSLDAPVLDAPVDRTGLCDHCDKPQTGGAAGGGIPPEHWCDDHRPDELGGPRYPDDQDAPDVEADDPWSELVAELAARLAAVNGEDDATHFIRWYPDAQAALAVFRARVGVLPSEMSAAEVYRTLFGNVGMPQ